jgi:hypothetical protein
VDAAEARRQLSADDTAIVEAAAEQLVRERTTLAMSFMCEAIASNGDPEVGETILWVLSPAWRSGEVSEIPELLEAVARQHEGDARRGAEEALAWLGLRA